MGYREIIPPERLEEFEAIGESEVQAKLDAGLYSGNHKKFAILFIKLCAAEREPARVPDEQTLEPDKPTPELVIPWHEKSWGKVIIGVLIVVFGYIVVALFRFLSGLS